MNSGTSRKRAALNCEPCRKRKIRCDRNHPCSNCKRSKSKVCVYIPQTVAPETQDTAARRSATSTAIPHADDRVPVHQGLDYPELQAVPSEDGRTTRTAFGTWHSTPLASVLLASDGKEAFIHPYSDRVYSELLKHPPGAPRDAISHVDDESQTTPSSVPDQKALFPPASKLSQPILGAFFKNRYLGASNWMYSWTLIPSAINILDEEMRAGGESRQLFLECKSLARSIKAQRILFPKTGCHDYGRHLPPRDVAELLFEAYLRTFGTIYPIHHVPSLRNDWELFWTSDHTTIKPDVVIPLQLCMAIGACYYDQQYSLRPQALHWVVEAYSWVAHLPEKSRLTMSSLRIMCLLHIARQTVGVEGDFVWLAAGTLLRIAVSMGVHIDPSHLPKMPLLQAELRRKLWATVLELCLSSSLDSGTPPLISLDDFNCQWPSNLDDSQLPESDVEGNTVAQPEDVFNSSSVQIALGRSFRLRFAIVKSVNGFGLVGGYDHALKLSSDLAAACRDLRTRLQGAAPESGPTPFQRCFCELVMQRYFLALHIPYMSAAITDTTYTFSQKTAVETALRLLKPALCPISPIYSTSLLATLEVADGSDKSRYDYARLMCCGFGPFRSVPLQCIMVIAAELINSLRDQGPMELSAAPVLLAGTESDRFGSSTPFGSNLRLTELHVMLRVGLEWTERRVRAGETNVKEHSFLALALALAETEAASGVVTSCHSTEVARERYRESLRHCKALLRELAEGSQLSTLSVGFPSSADLHQQVLDDTDDLWTSETTDIDWKTWMCF